MNKKITVGELVDVIKSINLLYLFGMDEYILLELVINNTYLIISDDKYRCANFLYFLINLNIFSKYNRKIFINLFNYFLRFNYLYKSCENDEYINSIVLLIEKSDVTDRNYLMNVIVNYMV